MQQVLRHQARRTNELILTGTPFDEDQVPPQQSQSQRIAPTIEFFQQVRDENGRQRLHGAFKGGFSAGYFNSVGSKEGWTPSSFYSSRTKRARQEPRNRLEGLIDEEDVEDDDPVFSIGGFPLDVKPIFGCLGNHQSQTTGILSSRGSSEKDSTQLLSDDILQLSPESFSLGFQILRRLGWRDSRVIGEEGNVKTAPVVKVHGPELPLKTSRHVSWQMDLSRNEDDVSGIGYETGKSLDWKRSKRETAQGLLYQTQSISYLEEDEDEYDVFNNQQEDYLESIQEVVEKREKVTKKAAEDNSSRNDVLLTKVQFRAANRQNERKVYLPPTVPENYDTKYYPDEDKYAADTTAGVIQASKRLLSSVKNAADRRVLLGESLLSVQGPARKVDAIDDTEEQNLKSMQPLTAGLSQEVMDKLNKSMTERFTSSSEENRASEETKAKVLSDSKKSQQLGVGESKRQVQFWQPSRLLCKRFNVPQPTVTGEATKRTTSRIYTELPVFETEKSVDQTHDTKDKQQKSGKNTNNTDLEKEETDLINSEFLRLRSERPSTELFRAIFEEDSEEEEGESMETKNSSESSLLLVQKELNSTSPNRKPDVKVSKVTQRPRAVDYF